MMSASKPTSSLSNGDMTAHNQEYFRSYGNLDVHRLMLKDKPRTLAYQQFMVENSHLLKDKVVLDVGAGTGILSLFAAKAGAKSVIAIEASDVANMCEQIVKANKMENVITVIKGMVEEVELPNIDKVDVIVSEWMGFYLLHEAMLDSVLFARDKWLKKDGCLLPSHVTIYTCPVNMTEFCRDQFECWEDLYGFDFSPFQHQCVQGALQQPSVTMLKQSQCLAEPEMLAKFDLKTVKLADVLDIEDKLAFEIQSDSILHGYAVWFDAKFSPYCDEKLSKPSEDTENGDTHHNGETVDQSDVPVHTVVLSTAPSAPETHWKQTVCFLPSVVTVETGETVYCKMSVCQDGTNKRHYNISLEMIESLEDSDSDSDDYDEDDLNDVSDHPMPCNCGSGKCRLIAAIMEKYEAVEDEQMEADTIDVAAKFDADQSLSTDIYCDGESVDSD